MTTWRGYLVAGFIAAGFYLTMTALVVPTP
jgi:hypothetical protein